MCFNRPCKSKIRCLKKLMLTIQLTWKVDQSLMFLSASINRNGLFTQTGQFTFYRWIFALQVCIAWARRNMHIRNSFWRVRDSLAKTVERTHLCTIVEHTRTHTRTHAFKKQTSRKLQQSSDRYNFIFLFDYFVHIYQIYQTFGSYVSTLPYINPNWCSLLLLV